MGLAHLDADVCCCFVVQTSVGGVLLPSSAVKYDIFLTGEVSTTDGAEQENSTKRIQGEYSRKQSRQTQETMMPVMT